MDEFERHRTPAGTAGQVHHAHPALPQAGDDAVGADRLGVGVAQGGGWHHEAGAGPQRLLQASGSLVGHDTPRR